MEHDEPKSGPSLNEIPGHISAFIKTKIAYYKLVAAEGSSKAVSAAVLGIILFFLAIFFLIFISVAAALGLGYLLNNHAWGFLIVAGVYLLMGVIIFAMRDTIITTPITNAIISGIAGSGAENPSNENSDNSENNKQANDTNTYNRYEEFEGRERAAENA